MVTVVNTLGGTSTLDDSVMGTAGTWNGSLTAHSKKFDAGVTDLQAAYDAALLAATQDPSSPAALSALQSTLTEYTLYRQLQTSTTKTLGDNLRTMASNT